MAIEVGGPQTSVVACGEKEGSLSQKKGVTDGPKFPKSILCSAVVGDGAAGTGPGGMLALHTFRGRQ